MHKQRIGIVVAAAVGMLATFLPWATVPFLGSISGTAGDGFITLILFLVALLMGVLGDKNTVVTGVKSTVAMLAGALAAVVGIYEIFNISSIAGEAGALGKAIGVGFGVYLVIICGIAVIAVGFVLKDK
jgi:hypothetical protein